jgi:nucleoside-diphosphate-sugar epimerase
MKIIFFGYKGWIGSNFLKILQDKYGNDSIITPDIRVDNINAIELCIKDIKPTHVISFIGRTHGIHNNVKYSTIDYLEQKGKLKENVNDNLFCPTLLALLSVKYNFHFTYLGTGCIFTENQHENINNSIGYNEDSLPDFFGSSYSTVKGFTDRLMHMFDNVLNLRIRMPISSEVNPRNFITKITNYEKICSINNSMTVLDELLPLICDMLDNNTTGTLNFTNPGTISHNEILELYKEIVDNDFTWKNFTLEEQSKILASDRSNNKLQTTKLETIFPNVSPIKDSIKNILINYKKNYIKNKL